MFHITLKKLLFRIFLPCLDAGLVEPVAWAVDDDCSALVAVVASLGDKFERGTETQTD